MEIAKDNLRAQWTKPGDILSLLLLIGGDIVRKAIAQLVGQRIHLPGNDKVCLHVVPVTFSFGWVAYGFTNLLQAVGDMQLMPANDQPCILVNASNAFVRETRSWALGRFLRDHEIRCPADAPPSAQGGDQPPPRTSLRIDIFNLEAAGQPTRDFVWWCGWVALLVQLGIAAIPWGLYGDWSAMMITLAGNTLVAVTCALPQWAHEKWSARVLRKQKVVCLTRGNGYRHVMVLIGSAGSWDLESLATGAATPMPATRPLSLILAFLWTCLLISISGLTENTWFLIGIGGVGMLQNVYAAGAPRSPEASSFHISKFPHAPTIIGRQERLQDDFDADVDLDQAAQDLSQVASWASAKTIDEKQDGVAMPKWLESMSREDGTPSWLEPRKPAPKMHHASNQNDPIYTAGVHGALVELEKWVPTAGLAMLPVFFPGSIKYNDDGVRDNVHKKFWKRAYHTVSVRQRGAEKQREMSQRSHVSV